MEAVSCTWQLVYRCVFIHLHLTNTQTHTRSHNWVSVCLGSCSMKFEISLSDLRFPLHLIHCTWTNTLAVCVCTSMCRCVCVFLSLRFYCFKILLPKENRWRDAFFFSSSFFLHQLSKFIWIHLSPDLGLLKICAPTKNNIPLFICFVFLSVFCLARKTLGQLAANYLQKIATETWYDLFVFLCVLLSAASSVQYVLWLWLYACVHVHPHAPVNTAVSLGPIVFRFYICGYFLDLMSLTVK